MEVMLPEHLGGLHPIETILVALLAFGPFVVLAVVVVMQRRRETSQDEERADQD